MMVVGIESFENINFTPAVRLAALGWADLISSGLSGDSVLIQWDDRALVAFVKDKPAGVLVWSKIDWQRAAFVKLGFVLPEFRRAGIYRALWEALVEESRKLKLHHIEGVTWCNNSVMREVAHRQGRSERTVGLWFEIPESGGGA